MCPLIKALHDPPSSWDLLKLPAANSVLSSAATPQFPVMECLRQGYVESPIFKVRLKKEPASDLRALAMDGAVVSLVASSSKSPLPKRSLATRPRDPLANGPFAGFHVFFLFSGCGSAPGKSRTPSYCRPGRRTECRCPSAGKVDPAGVRLWIRTPALRSGSGSYDSANKKDMGQVMIFPPLLQKG